MDVELCTADYFYCVNFDILLFFFLYTLMKKQKLLTCFFKRKSSNAQHKEIQKNALETHCHGHSLNLSVKDVTSQCKLLKDTIGRVGEICVLVKFSPKRENLLGELQENIEGDFKNEVEKWKPITLDKLCSARWTVRAKCYQNIIDIYDKIIELLDFSLKEGNLNTEVKGRVICCLKQMKEFDFYYGLLLSQRLYALTDNLSKTLQNKKKPAISGQRLAGLTLSTLERMRNDHDANLFFQTVVQKAEKHVEIKELELPRKRKKPRYDVLQYIDGYDANGEERQHKMPEEKYRQVYFEALDIFVVSLKERFEQPTYTIYANIEQLLLIAVNEEELYRDGLADIEQYYAEDIDLIALETEFHLLANLCKNTQILCFNDLLKVLKAAPVEQKLIPNVVLLFMILYVSPATSAAAERLSHWLEELKLGHDLP